MHIIFLNGPPRSGKDTVAEILANEYCAGAYSVGVFKAAAPLRRAICGFLNMSPQELEACKDAPVLSGHTTLRHLMQRLSEDVIKPLLGPEYLGIALAREIQENPADLCVVSDAGFQVEVNACVECLQRVLGPPPKFHLWRIERPGCSFAGDTREPVEPPLVRDFSNAWRPIRTATIENDGDMFDLRVKVNRLVNQL